jgi:superfamily II DNA or RNA helicase
MQPRREPRDRPSATDFAFEALLPRIDRAIDDGVVTRPEVESLCLLHEGKGRKALAKAEAALASDRSNIVLHLIAADAARSLGELDSAEEHLDSVQALLTTRIQRTRPQLVPWMTGISHDVIAARRRERAATRREGGTPGPRPKAGAPIRVAPLPEPLAPAAPDVPAPAFAFAPCQAPPPLPREPMSPAQALADYRLRLESQAISRIRSFETLLALGCIRGVDRYDYQIRTVTRVLRDFYGRALLADEVGLGKTVEACLCLKEYVLRGLVSRALVLVPPALRWQWRDELLHKFGIEATILQRTDGVRREALLAQPGVKIASLGMARLEPHATALSEAAFDLVIVDEAHRLKNRRTRSWQVVDRLKSRFLLLLSATPVENDLIEIYNMLSLLRPGLFSTEAAFKSAFLESASGRAVKDPEGLRRLLREVMIRNTRAIAEAKLPPRFATTLRAQPGPAEAAFYADLSETIRTGLQSGAIGFGAAGEVLRAAGSSPAAAVPILSRVTGSELADRAGALDAPAKDAVLRDLLGRNSDDKILLFCAHLETLRHVLGVVRSCGRKPVLFHGGLTPREREDAIESFRGDHDVLVASESGGEGFNLQFARTIVNYDLPWNPMRIEQRIGRVHRIGQSRDVFVFNLVTAGTLEEEILRILDEKINMFELVVGEVEAILGRLGDDEKEFQDLVLEIYAHGGTSDERRERFEALSREIVGARREYDAVRTLEAATFGRDLES